MDNVELYGLGNSAAKALLQAEERQLRLNMDYSGLEKELSRHTPRGPQEGFARGYIDKLATQYMQQAGYSASKAVRKAAEDFKNNHIQINNSWVNPFKLPVTIDPISQEEKKMTIVDLERVREEFIRQLTPYYEAEFSMEIDPDDIDLVVVPVGIQFTHKGLMPMFDHPLYEDGLLYNRNIAEVLDDRARNLMYEIGYEGKQKREQRKVNKEAQGLNAL